MCEQASECGVESDKWSHMFEKERGVVGEKRERDR